jgi:hypothetical protein
MSIGILLVILGVLAITVGIVGKDFHAADLDSGGAYEPKSSRWSGRLIAFIVGALFVAGGIKLLMGA